MKEIRHKILSLTLPLRCTVSARMEFIQRGFIAALFRRHKLPVPSPEANYRLQNYTAVWDSLVTLYTMLSSSHLFEFSGAPHGFLCRFPGLFRFVQIWRTFNLLHWALPAMCSGAKDWVIVPAVCKVHTARQPPSLHRSPVSIVPTGGAVYPTGAHTGLTFLNSCPETNGLCWGTAAGKEEKKSPFFIIPRCILICTSDIVSVMDYTKGNITAQQARRGKK